MQVREVFRAAGAELACVIVEPVAGNMNCIPPAPRLSRVPARGVFAPRHAADL